jgi:hypothetical protein
MWETSATDPRRFRKTNPGRENPRLCKTNPQRWATQAENPGGAPLEGRVKTASSQKP